MISYKTICYKDSCLYSLASDSVRGIGQLITGEKYLKKYCFWFFLVFSQFELMRNALLSLLVLGFFQYFVAISVEDRGQCTRFSCIASCIGASGIAVTWNTIGDTKLAEKVKWSALWEAIFALHGRGPNQSWSMHSVCHKLNICLPPTEIGMEIRGSSRSFPLPPSLVQ